MRVKLYGTRGSIPICNSEFNEFGGNTTSILIQTDEALWVIDAGTGIRECGKEILANSDSSNKRIFMTFSHFHWDHIQGFPFFQPAYDSGREIIINTIGRSKLTRNIKGILEVQMLQEFYPIPLSQMGAKLTFNDYDESEVEIEGCKISTVRHTHPGGAYSFRFEHDGKSIVFSTDVEHSDRLDKRVIDIAQGADLLIHDAQYTPDEIESKKGWGHSSYEQSIEAAKQANVKHLLLTHHDPDHTDQILTDIEKKCQKLFKSVKLAKDNMEIII